MLWFSFINIFVVVQLLSHVQHFVTTWTAACQAFLSFTVSQSLLTLMYIELVMPIHPLLLPSPLVLNLSQHQGFFQRVSSHQVAKVLELQPQHQSLQGIFKVDFLWDWLVWSPFGPRDSQESSPAPQFKSINSSALGLLYGPALTSIHDYWKNHRFDYTDLCQQRDISAFFFVN